MRSADPAAYDQFAALTTATAFNFPFRAIYFTHSADTSASCVVTQITNGTAVTKTILINIPSTGGSFILPISGESVNVTFASGNCYALI